MNLFDNSAEQSVLGSCLLDNEVFDRISFLTIDDFYHRVHRDIYKVMIELNESGTRYDPLILSNYISEEDVGFTYLTDLPANTPSEKNAVAYADIVKDMANRRNMLTIFKDATESLSDKRSNALDVFSEVSGSIDSVITSCSVGEVLSIDDLISKTMDAMEGSNSGVKTGLSTGIREIDERLGYRKMAFGEITVIGGLSKNGKTLLANSITSSVDMGENEVGHVFSIEMTTEAMFNAIISAKTGVPADFYCRQDHYSMRNQGQYDVMHRQWGAAAREMQQSQRLTFDGKKEVNVDYICAGMKKQAAMARQRGKVLRYVVIDHLHRMNFKTDGGPLTYAIRDAVRRIKNTASELGVAVVLLAQLNNKAESLDPTSFHILDSSSVRHELQAFIGIRLHRQDGEAYFGIHVDSQRFADVDTKFHPAYMKLNMGILSSLPEHYGEHWRPRPVELQD